MNTTPNPTTSEPNATSNMPVMSAAATAAVPTQAPTQTPHIWLPAVVAFALGWAGAFIATKVHAPAMAECRHQQDTTNATTKAPAQKPREATSAATFPAKSAPITTAATAPTLLPTPALTVVTPPEPIVPAGSPVLPAVAVTAPALAAATGEPAGQEQDERELTRALFKKNIENLRILSR